MSLKLVNIRKAFGDKLLFDGFSYDFPDAGIFAISGKSGSGKTTLLRMICGLDTEFDGDIIGGGAKCCSYAFQEYRLFPNLCALDNVILSQGGKKSEEIRDASQKILKNLGFSEDEMLLKPSQLSGGMKQRVSIARAILKMSPVLLLDEPTKELDALLKNALYQLISEEAKKRLVLLVTHSEDDVSVLEATKIEI